MAKRTDNIKTEEKKKDSMKKKTIKKDNKKVVEEATVITKKDSNNSKKNAAFIERLGAFIIDFFIISIIVSFITYPFINNSNYKKLNDEATALIEKYQNGDIKPETYINRAADINYDIARQTGLSSVISVIIFALYFIVFQYKKDGQTFGKKLLKLRIVKSDCSELTINDIMFRALIVDFILYNIISLCIMLFVNKNAYFYTVMIFESIQWLVLFISAIMILSRKDKRGIHDLITHTEVIKENILVEEVEGARI